jgi:hypothetical protein
LEVGFPEHVTLVPTMFPFTKAVQAFIVVTKVAYVARVEQLMTPSGAAVIHDGQAVQTSHHFEPCHSRVHGRIITMVAFMVNGVGLRENLVIGREHSK